MASAEDRQIYELWRSAAPLSQAWIEHGNADWKRQLEDGKNPARAEIAKLLMVDDMYRRIAAGEWTAFGLQIKPDLSDRPLVVPPHIFDQQPKPDWQKDRISASRRSFDRVRVIYTPWPRQDDGTLTVEGVPDTKPTPEVSAINPPEVERPAKKERRPNTYQYSEIVLQELAKEDGNPTRLPAEKLWPHFAEKFEQIHPHLKGVLATPQARTLRDQLKKFRSAKIGKNRQE